MTRALPGARTHTHAQHKDTRRASTCGGEAPRDRERGLRRQRRSAAGSHRDPVSSERYGRAAFQSTPNSPRRPDPATRTSDEHGKVSGERSWRLGHEVQHRRERSSSEGPDFPNAIKMTRFRLPPQKGISSDSAARISSRCCTEMGTRVAT